MTFLDWVLLLVWLGVTLSGFWEGAVRLVFGGGGLIAGLWLAFAVGGDAAAALEPVVKAHWPAAVLGRALPLVGCVLLAFAAGWGIERTLKALHLKWFNRLAGAVLAGGVAVLLLGLFLATAARLSETWQSWCSESLLAPRLVRLWGLALEAGDDVVEVIAVQTQGTADCRRRVPPATGGSESRAEDSCTRPDREGAPLRYGVARGS